MSPLRIGVLGAGMIATGGGGVLPNLDSIRHKAEVVAIADVVPDLAKTVAGRFGIPNAFTSLEAMLDGVELDAVVNLTPIPVHGRTCAQILAAGKHLATEKPLATSMEDADRICELAAESDLTVVCAPFNMLYPDRAEARRLVREGAIGKVAFARVRSSHGGPASGAWPADPTWFYQKGSGPLFDMGVYGIHEITGILGPARRVVAFAGITEPTRTVRGGPFQGKTIDVTADDNVLMLLDFGESTFAVVDGTFNVNAARGPKLEIYGREGTINLSGRPFGGDGPPLEIFRMDAVGGLRGWIAPDLPDGDAPMRRLVGLHRAVLVDHLADCVASGTRPLLNLEHARHVLEIMLKADEAARTGQAQELTTTFSLPE
ncbi:putative dehydrogenase [Kribbella rubisoli]|uniref:Dehydrogenase n=1 Tax=Kribbella rubisoli TaxID=3075929 RepID=A0A4Q7WLI3_9ACTN|nr:Gfo/Idh/MocA family oxidoreductase [Kribbella rubisoli]RZU10944.1 putative dehydrogenase [Kribbella rubisoli]